MKYASTISTLAIASLLAIGCSDNDQADLVEDRMDDDIVAQDVYNEPVIEQPVYTPPVAPETTPVTDRAAEPTTYNSNRSGLMQDEIRYRNSDGSVNWNSVPDEEIDGLSPDWD